MKMRRVYVFKYEEQHRGMLKKVPNGEAWFHTWGSDFEEFETGPGNFTTAIIERDDGSIESVPATLIQFADGDMAERALDELDREKLREDAEDFRQEVEHD